MICWGCMCWIAGVYTLVSLWLVSHPFELPPILAVGILLGGLFFVWMNFDADDQRQRTRDTKGNTIIWGRKPEVIEATYRNSKGEEHKNLLLVSGWWGVARHFQYVPELLLSLMWTLPCGFTHVLPYFYVFFLTILLVDRSHRDDVRCSEKYRAYWRKYCERVPYRMIPGIF